MSDDGSDMMDAEEVQQEVEDKGLDAPDVVTKYTTGAGIANKALELAIRLVVPGAVIVDVCAAVDAFMTEETGKIYNKVKTDKGIAFPCCISVNNIVCHYNPVAGDKGALKEGDVAKIDLGVQIDGYISVVAHTVVVGNNGVFSGRKADVVAAAYTAAECAKSMLKAGSKSSDITAMFGKVAAIFQCNAVQCVLSHQMKRYVIDGNKTILSRTDPENKVAEVEFEAGEVYAIDIVMSTGEGKPRELDERTTVFKRAIDQTYQLKMQASRKTLSEINQHFPTFPFSARHLSDARSKLGLTECIKHNLLVPYPVLFEREGEFTAHFKFTALLMPTGTLRVTGAAVDRSKLETQFKIEDPELLAMLASEPSKKDKKKNKKKKKKSAAAAADSDSDDNMED
jgi:curved DNA binding protein